MHYTVRRSAASQPQKKDAQPPVCAFFNPDRLESEEQRCHLPHISQDTSVTCQGFNPSRVFLFSTGILITVFERAKPLHLPQSCVQAKAGTKTASIHPFKRLLQLFIKNKERLAKCARCRREAEVEEKPRQNLPEDQHGPCLCGHCCPCLARVFAHPKTTWAAAGPPSWLVST